MGSSSRDARNESAKKLLDYGFANYCYVCYPSAELDAIELVGANCRECKIFCEEYHSVLNKSEGSGITVEYDIPECIEAPVHEGDVIGRIVYKSNGEYIGEADVKSMQSVDKISFSEQFINILKIFLMF